MATLGAALLALILVHAHGGEIHPAASAALTCGLVISWLVSAARGGTRPATANRPGEVRADYPKLAAALTDRPSRPPTVWAPIGLRALAFVLIAAGTLTSTALLILVAFAVFGIAHLSGTPTSSPSSTNPD
jgi:hypothetical protein